MSRKLEARSGFQGRDVLAFADRRLPNMLAKDGTVHALPANDGVTMAGWWAGRQDLLSAPPGHERQMAAAPCTH